MDPTALKKKLIEHVDWYSKSKATAAVDGAKFEDGVESETVPRRRRIILAIYPE